MAMGIFEQLSWLTTRVKRLCCAIKVGAFQERSIDVTPLETDPNPYLITEGGMYQFYGGTATNVTINFALPTSAGQVMYIVNNSTDTLQFAGDRPIDGASDSAVPGGAGPNEIWQFISTQSTPGIGFPPYLIWRAFKMYPNVV